jgi:putative ABC transport system permease protein
VKYAVRQLIKNRGFAAVSILTLALGIGVNTTTFSLVYALLYRLPPYPDPNRIVMVYATTEHEAFQSHSPANLQDELKQLSLFERASAYNYVTSNLGQPGEPAKRVSGLQVGGDYFAILGVAPLMGRILTPLDDRFEHNDVVLVSERFWREKLGANPNALGSKLRLDAKPVTVVGIMPDNCQDLPTWGPVEIWQPLGYGKWDDRRNNWLGLIGRLKPGVTMPAVQTQLSTIASRLEHDYPDTNAGRGLRAVLYKDVHTQGSTLISWVIMGLMLFVLLIACINLANLQLARTSGRSREYAVRIALGASQGQLIRQLLSESLLLSIAGGALGLLVAIWGNRLLGSRIHMGPDDARLVLSLDYHVLGFTFGVSVLTGILFGLMPARFASRTDVNAALKKSGRGSTGDRGKNRMRRILVAAELALALALLSGAGFFVRGVQRLQRYETNWRTSNLVTGSVALPWNSYTNDDQLRAAAVKMEAGLAALPGVDHAAISLSLPLFSFSGMSSFLIDGQPAPANDQAPKVFTERITPDYFSTLGIHLLAGREFTPADRGDSKGVIIINRAMADKFWPNGDAIGHRIGTLVDPKKPDWREIVGIVSDVKFVRNQDSGARFQSYHPLAQDPDHYLTFSIHTVGRPEPLLDAARRAITRIDPDVAVYNLVTVDQEIERSGSNMALVGQLLSVAALLGLLLALVGIYGVVAYLAAQRTQEIGIRMALGAQREAVLRLILFNGAKLAAAGTLVGLFLAYGLTRGLGVAMPDIPGQDPVLIVVMALLLVGATLLACWVPARRATRIDPVVALRDE